MTYAAIILACYALVAAAVWFIVRHYRFSANRQLLYRLRLEGRQAEAEILGKHLWDIAELMRQMPEGAEKAEVDEASLPLTKQGQSYILEYRMDIPGDRQAYHFFRHCYVEEWKAADVGSYITVVYSPENPALHALKLNAGLGSVALAIALFWIAIALLPFL